MNRRSGGDVFLKGNGSDFNEPARSSRVVFGAFWVLLFIASFLVSGPWAGFHGVLLGCVGVLMAVAPPSVRLPRLWWILAAVFIVAGCACFLPAAWFETPAWRKGLENLGVETGSLVVIQSRQAGETLVLFAIMLLTALWLAGHRATATQVRCWALAFTIGVAVYAVVAKMMQDSIQIHLAAADEHFGFFPNRNHSATYLAMGSICGLGCGIQALRDKRFLVMSIALAATGVCLWAAVAWSISRAGVVLVALGGLLWLPMLGRRYLGKHGLWACGLLALAAVGLFFISDSRVKQRLSTTVENAGSVIGPSNDLPAAKSARSLADLDFRIPTALDTLDLIREFKWTGIGAGQYFFVYPQYRKRTIIASDGDSYHPESDWLWMAAEAGIPATLVLATGVLLALRKSQLGIHRGRDRGIRSACLVAAMLVLIHGLFDVPGHRITLAWAAAFLFTLSLHAPSPDDSTAPPRAWPSRILAFTLLAAGAFLIRAQWWGGPQPALTTARVALTESKRLFNEDQALQQLAMAEGRVYQPDPADDNLEHALALLSQAAPIAPLDRDLLRYQAFLALHFDDKSAEIDRWFAIDRALDPTWVEGPFWQAAAWSATKPEKTATLWMEALRRAKALDQIQPQNRWAVEPTLHRIRDFAYGKPELETFIPTPE